MRPATPLLVLTIGQGLAGGIIVCLAALMWMGRLTGPEAIVPVLVGLGTAAVGGMGSFFHMHNLKAARYVMRRLKTSWLSREALTTAIFGALLAVLTVWTLFDGAAVSSVGYQTLLVVTAATGVLAMWVTAMLYATIPAVLSWHTPLTVLNLMLVGITSGVAVTAGWVSAVPSLWIGFAILLALTAAVKLLHWTHFRRAHGQIRAETGTGLPFSPYRLQDTGTSKPPYRTQTQVWPVLHPALLRTVKLWTVGWLFVIPLAAVVVWQTGAWNGARWVLPVGAMLGVIAERWLFFADATHSSRVFFVDEPRRAPQVPMTGARKSM